MRAGWKTYESATKNAQSNTIGSSDQTKLFVFDLTESGAVTTVVGITALALGLIAEVY